MPVPRHEELGWETLSGRGLRAAACALLFCAAACGAGGGGQASDPERPNVLLVSIDCLRADHLSCYGYARETSPNLDRLAREGVRFERVWAATCWTLPAHLSMLTGLPVSAHGIDDDRLWLRKDTAGQPLPAPLRAVFVSELFSEAGYATAGFYTWQYLEPRYGFGPGFDVYERWGHTFYSHPEVGPRFERLQQAKDTEGMKALAAEYPDLFDPRRASSPETIDRAIEWLDGLEDGRPFFLFVHLFDAHDPYVPPEPWFSKFDPGYDGPIDGLHITSPDSPVHPGMAPRDLDRVVSLYDGAIAFVDHELQRLLEHLDARGVADRTLVAVTADHGEEFFEHGMKTHRNQLYAESIAVPLLLRWPAGLPAGRVVEGAVGQVDIAPTLLAAAGLAPATPLAGVDLMPFARGERSNEARTYVSELVRFQPGEDVPTRQVALARGAGETALLATRGQAPWTALRFDLAGDPGQRNGRPAEAAWIDGELARVRERLTALRGAQPHRAVGAEGMTQRQLEELQALGYGGDRDVEAGDAPERLSLDGGVWADR